MSRLTWDNTGERLYETGVRNCVLYPVNGSTYPLGVAWNGISQISENPSGADANPIYADDIKYLNLTSAEEFGANITAYTYPDEFAVCDGSAVPEGAAGVTVGQQPRKMFGLCYRTTLGNDTEGEEYGYKLHLVYGCKAAPSEKGYQTINDSPEAIEFSWELTTTPVSITGMKPTSILTIDSTKCDSVDLEALEEVLYGSENADPRLPLPDEVIGMFAGSSYEISLNRANLNLTVDDTYQLKATVSPVGTTVTWTSGNTSTATVANGLVTAKAAGTTTITASISDGTNTYSDVCNLKVAAKS